MTVATSTRFSRPADLYNGNTALANYLKFRNDETSDPPVAIDAQKVDGDINNLINAVNLIDDDLTALVAGTVTDNSITNAKLRDSSALSIIGRSANTSGDPADITAGSDGEVLRRSGTTLGFGQLANGAYGDLSITGGKLANGTITTTQIASATIAGSNIASGTIAASNCSIASQAEAEAGTISTKLMTPERVSQAISALGSGSSGLVPLAQVTASGDASVSFSDTYLTSTYDSYIVFFSNVYMGTGGADLRAQLNGLSSGHQYGGRRCPSSGSATDAQAFNVGYFSLAEGCGNLDTEAHAGFFTIDNPSDASATKGCTWQTGGRQDTNGYGVWQSGGGMNSAATAAITSLTFLPSTGTFTGTFRLYGVAKS